MEYSVYEAKTHFSKLLAEMQNGHEVLITNGRERTPIAQLVPYKPKGGIKIGLYAHTEMANISEEEALAPLYTPEDLEEMGNKSVFPK